MLTIVYVLWFLVCGELSTYLQVSLKHAKCVPVHVACRLTMDWHKQLLPAEMVIRSFCNAIVHYMQLNGFATSMPKSCLCHDAHACADPAGWSCIMHRIVSMQI